jgi:hypothetical protein
MKEIIDGMGIIGYDDDSDEQKSPKIENMKELIQNKKDR